MSRIATVIPVSEKEASPRVAAVFADIRQTKKIDRVPNFWRTLATNPDMLETVWGNVKRWMHPEQSGRQSRLDANTREIIALAVSATNGCSYCINSHTTALVKQGMDKETLGEVLAIAGLYNMTNAIAEGFQVQPDVLPPQDT